MIRDSDKLPAKEQEKYVRVIRVLEYVGPRDSVESTIARSYHGRATLPNGVSLLSVAVREDAVDDTLEAAITELLNDSGREHDRYTDLCVYVCQARGWHKPETPMEREIGAHCVRAAFLGEAYRPRESACWPRLLQRREPPQATWVSVWPMPFEQEVRWQFDVVLPLYAHAAHQQAKLQAPLRPRDAWVWYALHALLHDDAPSARFPDAACPDAAWLRFRDAMREIASQAKSTLTDGAERAEDPH